MKTILFTMALVAAFYCNTKVLAKDLKTTGSVQIISTEQSTAFGKSSEAGMMRRAYWILASGDHDYKGHRAKAMGEVRAAADLLGLDLKGDDKDKEPQPLSDERLREAKGLLQNVLGASVVKGQKRIENRINGSINQINIALTIR